MPVILAVNNPGSTIVQDAIRNITGAQVLWCDGLKSLKELNLSAHSVEYVALGPTGKLKLRHLKPYLRPNMDDVAVFGDSSNRRLAEFPPAKPER